MYFAAIYKQREKDFWVVVQGLPFTEDDETDGGIVYQGPGKPRIAELLRDCYHTFHKSKPATKKGVNPALAAFGCEDEKSLGQHTNAITLWAINDEIYGFITLEKSAAPDWHLEFNFATDAAQMDTSLWTRTSWEQIQRGFEYIERCDR